MAKRNVLQHPAAKVESKGIIKIDLSDDSRKILRHIQKDLNCDEALAIDIIIKFVKPAELKNNILLAKKQKELFEIEKQISELEVRKREIINQNKYVAGRVIQK